MTGARYAAQNIAAPERVHRAIAGIESNLQDDPGVVFDYAKSLIETTCKTLMKERGYEPDEDWKLQQLARFTLKAVVQVPSGHSDPESAKSRLETTLQGLIGVVQGVGELRNQEGEIGHGKEASRIGLTSCHAEFAARAADAVVKFLVESHLGPKSATDKPEEFTYSENQAFNDSVDELHDPVVIFSGQYKPSEVLFQMDRQTYRDALAEFALKTREEPQ